jgi:hypothetical protein
MPVNGRFEVNPYHLIGKYNAGNFLNTITIFRICDETCNLERISNRKMKSQSK